MVKSKANNKASAKQEDIVDDEAVLDNDLIVDDTIVPLGDIANAWSAYRPPTTTAKKRLANNNAARSVPAVLTRMLITRFRINCLGIRSVGGTTRPYVN